MNSHKNNVKQSQKESSSSLFNILFSGAYLGLGAYFGYQALNHDDLKNGSYNKKLADNQKNCPICFDEFESKNKIKSLPCNHIYHSDCIQGWVSTNSTCPLCRKQFD